MTGTWFWSCVEASNDVDLDGEIEVTIRTLSGATYVWMPIEAWLIRNPSGGGPELNNDAVLETYRAISLPELDQALFVDHGDGLFRASTPITSIDVRKLPHVSMNFLRLPPTTALELTDGIRIYYLQMLDVAWTCPSAASLARFRSEWPGVVAQFAFDPFDNVQWTLPAIGVGASFVHDRVAPCDRERCLLHRPTAHAHRRHELAFDAVSLEPFRFDDDGAKVCDPDGVCLQPPDSPTRRES